MAFASVRDCSGNPFLFFFALGVCQMQKKQKRLKRKARRRIFLAAARPNKNAVVNRIKLFEIIVTTNYKNL
jgi:hypothetical protein